MHGGCHFNLNSKQSRMWPICCIAYPVRLTVRINTRHGYVRAAIALCTVRYERSLHRIFCLPIGTTENTLVFTVLCSAHCVWCVSQGIFVKKFFRSHSLIRILCELCFGSEQGLRAHIMRLPHNPYGHLQLSLNPIHTLDLK